MPKKFQGENSKSAAARARRAEAKAAAEARRQQELEDELWKDEDKHVLRKEQRKVRIPKSREGGGSWGGCDPRGSVCPSQEEWEKRCLEQLELLHPWVHLWIHP